MKESLTEKIVLKKQRKLSFLTLVGSQSRRRSSEVKTVGKATENRFTIFPKKSWRFPDNKIKIKLKCHYRLREGKCHSLKKNDSRVVFKCKQILAKQHLKTTGYFIHLRKSEEYIGRNVGIEITKLKIAVRKNV